MSNSEKNGLVIEKGLCKLFEQILLVLSFIPWAFFYGFSIGLQPGFHRVQIAYNLDLICLVLSLPLMLFAVRVGSLRLENMDPFCRKGFVNLSLIATVSIFGSLSGLFVGDFFVSYFDLVGY